MRFPTWLIGPLCMWFGAFGVAATANPWGTPAMQPWFTIFSGLGGFGAGTIAFELKRAREAEEGV